MPASLLAPPIVPLEILGAIRASTYRLLFDAHGYPPSLDAAKCANASLDEIVAALSPEATSAQCPARLSRALITIMSFANEPGRVHVYNAAGALGYETRWPHAISPADLIALVVAASANDDLTLELLEAAKILRDRDFRQWAVLVYVGLRDVDPTLGDASQYVDAWRREVGAWCKARDFGAVLDIRVHTAGSKTTVEILHEDRARTDVLVSSKTGKLTVVTRRPVRTHFVTYDHRTRRLANTTDCMEAATPIAMIAGLVYFSNAAHFFVEPALDLSVLQREGKGALVVKSLVDRLTALAIAGTWHSGKDHAMTPRGDNFFEALARYKIRIEGGRLTQTTLRATRTATHARDDGPAQCDVAIRPPHQLTISEPELAPLLELYLERAHITDPEPRVRDFYSLQPWIDTRPVWELTLGAKGFAELLRRGILKKEEKNRYVAPPGAPLGGRSAIAYPLRGDKWLAYDPDPTIAPFIVHERDLEVYALQFNVFAAAVAAELGLQSTANGLDDDGVLFFGSRDLGGVDVFVYLLTRPVRDATTRRLFDAAKPGHAVLFVPPGHVSDGAPPQIAMPALDASWFPQLGAIVRAVGVASRVDTFLYAPADARIVLHRASMRTWVDRILCKEVSEASFKALEILISRSGQAVHSKEIADHVAGRLATSDTTRTAINAFEAAVTRAFERLGLTAPADLGSFIDVPRHGHRSLTVKGFID